MASVCVCEGTLACVPAAGVIPMSVFLAALINYIFHIVLNATANIGMKHVTVWRRVSVSKADM